MEDLCHVHYYADNLVEGIHKIKNEDCDCLFEYKSVHDHLIKCKCLFCNKGYLNKLDKEPKKRFKHTFKFRNNDTNKFILLLRKSVYAFEYIDEWEKFYETSLYEKEEFYSDLNMEDITHADYIYTKRV